MTSGYMKEIKGYMHFEGFYFPADYKGPKQIAPMCPSDGILNRFYDIASKKQSNSTQ
jgi:hypothetical protein